VALAYTFDGDRLRPIETGSARPLRWAAWRPDGSLALLIGNRGTAFFFDGARFTHLPTGITQNLRGVGWSPDGKTALLVGNRGAVLCYSGEGVQALACPTAENLRRVAWHPSGRYALIVGNAGTCLRYDPPLAEGDAGTLGHVPGDRAHTLRCLAFRPDGAYALVGAYASRWAGYPRPHALYRCDGRYLQALLTTDDEDDLVAIDWRPSGSERPEALVVGYSWHEGGEAISKLLTYDGSGFRYREVRGHGLLWGAGWHPSGEYALLVGEEGALIRYDGEVLKEVNSETRDNLVGPFWKPDGSQALILRGPGEKVYTV
jgi:hypothetical protein